MNVMCPLICVHSFEVHRVPNHMVFIADTISTQHITSSTCHVQRLATVVALDHRDHLRCSFALVFQSSDSHSCVQSKGDVSRHVGELELNQLVLGKWNTELYTVQSVLACNVHTLLSCAHHSPLH
jgi:hypothetical protein